MVQFAILNLVTVRRNIEKIRNFIDQRAIMFKGHPQVFPSVCHMKQSVIKFASVVCYCGQFSDGVNV